MPLTILCVSLGLFLLTGCGSNPSGSSPSASGASATATACAQTTRPATSSGTATGTLKSMSAQTLVMTTLQGQSVTVTYTSTTTFTQEVKIAASDLKEGASVSVVVTSTGGTYTAMSIQASSGTGTSAGSSGFGFPGSNGAPGTRGGGSNPCFANRGRFGNSTPGANTGNFRGLVGTLSQVNGDILTITDNTGSSYTVTLTANTQIIEAKQATAAALKVGEPLTAVGKSGSQNTVAASTIAILLSLPTRGAPASTPTT